MTANKPVYGIDVSAWNGAINWANVKKTGCGHAVLKCLRHDLNPDKQFLANLRGVRTQGIPYSVYTYVYEGATKGAQKRAQAVVELLGQQGVPAGTMVWWDVEDSGIQPVGRAAREQLQESILTAQRIIRAAGYGFGVYTGLWWYHSVLGTDKLRCPFWIARYPSKQPMAFGKAPAEKYRPKIQHPLWGWQYTSTGIVPGCTGNSGHTDLNEVYGVAEASGAELPCGCLRRGSVGDAVVLLQAALNEHGAGLATDGIFGAKTEMAVRAYQAEQGLVVDGICGPKTWGALRA